MAVGSCSPPVAAVWVGGCVCCHGNGWPIRGWCSGRSLSVGSPEGLASLILLLYLFVGEADVRPGERSGKGREGRVAPRCLVAVAKRQRLCGSGRVPE